MKCPKCGYIGFEPSDRCKNCGYEFSLAAVSPPPAPELPISVPGDEGGPLSDLALTPSADRARKSAPLDLDRVIGAPDTAGDLPLFGSDQAPAADLPPLVAPRANPRRPLAVRRPTPDPARLRARLRDEPRERVAAPTLPLPHEPSADAPVVPRSAVASPGTARSIVAPALPRLAAALADTVLLAGIDALTLYFTVRLCGLTMRDWSVLPLVPLGAFFVLVNGGYLALFTAAGGQTIGKMAFGLKVVSFDNGPVPVGLAAVRALGSLASTCCLGLGLLPGLVGASGLALHDRLADTRVVRADA